MKFKNHLHVKTSFVEGKINFPCNIELEESLGDTSFKHVGSVFETFEDMLTTKSKCVVVSESAKQLMLFAWAVDAKQRLVPSDVIVIDKPTTSVVEAIDPNDPNIIGDSVQIKFTSLPGSPALKGKVDTGADISSLHADKWSVQGDRVSFTCSKLSPNVIVLPLRDQQAVKSVSGVQYRPVVELSVRINDKIMNNMLFNIADRGSMDFPVLIGQNILEKGKFLINPSLRENEENPNNFDPKFILEQVASVSAPIENNNQKIQEVYKILKDNDVNFSDLVKYVHTEVTKTFEDVKY